MLCGCLHEDVYVGTINMTDLWRWVMVFLPVSSGNSDSTQPQRGSFSWWVVFVFFLNLQKFSGQVFIQQCHVSLHHATVWRQENVEKRTCLNIFEFYLKPLSVEQKSEIKDRLKGGKEIRQFFLKHLFCFKFNTLTIKIWHLDYFQP